MTSPSTQTQEPPEDAAAWFARLQDEDCGEADWQAFTAWLEADPANPQAYAAVEALWVDLDAAERVEAPTTAPNVVPLPLRRVSGWRPAAAIAAIAGIAAAVVLFIGPSILPSSAVEYATPLGQPRQVVLTDGSRLVLNGGSRLTVRMQRRERSVELTEGEATFDVTHDPSRPFRIAAGSGRIEVVGTEFDVLHHAGGLTVTVRRGLVAVTPEGVSDSARVLLPAGKQLRQSPGGKATVSDVDPAQAFAWQSGQLIYRDASLAQVAEDLSRYAGKPVRVDPAAANLRVTGALTIEAPDEMVRRLETFLPIEAQISADEIHLSAARRKP